MTMSSLKQLFGGGLRQYGMVIALLALIAIFQIATGGLVLTPSNAQNIITGNSYILILAIGMVLVIIAGHIDLSVGSVAAVAGIIVAIALRDWGLPWWAGILVGLAAGAVIGAWQGMWVAYIGIPGFITTLAGMMFFRGLNQRIGHSTTVPVPEPLQQLGAGYLPEWGPNTGLNNSTLVLGILAFAAVVWTELRRRARAARLQIEPTPVGISVARIVMLGIVIGYVTFLFGSGRYGTSFPIPGVLLVVLVIVYHFISQRTIGGRHVYAVGGNRAAAALSGVNIRHTNFFVMMNMSILAAVAGMVYVGRATASGPQDGNMWELDAIAAVFIGGAAVSGGVGTVVGSVIGGLVMAVLNNGLQLLGADSDMTQMIKGLVLLVAVAFDVHSKINGRPSIIGLIFPWIGNRKKPGGTPGADEAQPEVPVADGASAER